MKRTIAVLILALGATALAAGGGRPVSTALPGGVQIGTAAAAQGRQSVPAAARKPIRYQWHYRIVSTTFWVGEIFNSGPNGSQVISTYDAHWEAHYGGCDGLVQGAVCRTERRVAANGYFPRHMTPKQNPFYLDVPFDDVNDPIAAAVRARVVPWAHLPAYRARLPHPNQSIMKNHWVEIRSQGHICFGQVEDAGPGRYHDANYVFGSHPPSNRLYNHAGMDVSPALNGCLHFKELNGENDVVRWRFVEPRAVPPGPWRKLVTKT